MKTRFKILTTLAAGMFLFSHVAVAQWTISEEAKNAKSTSPTSVESVMAGKTLFERNCKSCHGDPGAGNAIALTPKPTDLGSPDFQARSTEGSVFYQITEGLGTMPSFKTSLKDDECWQLAHYIRSFSAEGAVDLSSQKKELDLRLDVTGSDFKLKAIAYDKTADGKSVPAEGVKVAFYIKRYFGNLPIGTATTNSNGFASADFPTDIPGRDSIGTTEVIVKFAAEDLYGNKEIKADVPWGKPNEYIDLLDEAQMWGTRANAPMWLVITYLAVVIGVWLTIFWVLGQLMKIRSHGKWH